MIRQTLWCGNASKWISRKETHTNIILCTFNIPRVKTCQSTTFYYSAIKDWNELPLSIKETKSKEVFKTNVKKFMLQKGLSRQDCEFYFY